MSSDELRAELERRPKDRIASSRLVLPAAAPWRGAEVHVRWRAVWPKERFDFHNSPYQMLDQSLLLGDAQGSWHEVLLDSYYLGGGIAGVDVPWPEFVAMLDARYQLRAASDGHALALSSDGGKTWRYVGLDAGPQPLYCRHLSWTAAASPASDPFSGAPTTRSLALEIFAATDPALPSIHRGPDSPAVSRFQRELRAAGDFACLHRHDGDLGRALVKALLSPDSWMTSDQQIPLIACAASIADNDRAAHALIMAALGAPSDLARQRAAALLAGSGGVDAQDALARALVAPDFRSGAGALTLGAFASALARITIDRRAGSDQTRSALRALAVGALAATHDASGASPEALAARDVRANAVRGLAALAAHDPAALAALHEIARVGCEPSPWSSHHPELPAWTAQLSGASDAEGNPWTPSCWAAAALAHLSRAR